MEDIKTVDEIKAKGLRVPTIPTYYSLGIKIYHDLIEPYLQRSYMSRTGKILFLIDEVFKNIEWFNNLISKFYDQIEIKFINVSENYSLADLKSEYNTPNIYFVYKYTNYDYVPLEHNGKLAEEDKFMSDELKEKVEGFDGYNIKLFCYFPQHIDMNTIMKVLSRTNFYQFYNIGYFVETHELNSIANTFGVGFFDAVRHYYYQERDIETVKLLHRLFTHDVFYTEGEPNKFYIRFRATTGVGRVKRAMIVRKDPDQLYAYSYKRMPTFSLGYSPRFIISYYNNNNTGNNTLNRSREFPTGFKDFNINDPHAIKTFTILELINYTSKDIVLQKYIHNYNIPFILNYYTENEILSFYFRERYNIYANAALEYISENITKIIENLDNLSNDSLAITLNNFNIPNEKVVICFEKLYSNGVVTLKGFLNLIDNDILTTHSDILSEVLSLDQDIILRFVRNNAYGIIQRLTETDYVNIAIKLGVSLSELFDNNLKLAIHPDNKKNLIFLGELKDAGFSIDYFYNKGVSMYIISKLYSKLEINNSFPDKNVDFLYFNPLKTITELYDIGILKEMRDSYGYPFIIDEFADNRALLNEYNIDTIYNLLNNQDNINYSLLLNLSLNYKRLSNSFNFLDNRVKILKNLINNWDANNQKITLNSKLMNLEFTIESLLDENGDILFSASELAPYFEYSILIDYLSYEELYDYSTKSTLLSHSSISLYYAYYDSGNDYLASKLQFERYGIKYNSHFTEWIDKFYHTDHITYILREISPDATSPSYYQEQVDRLLRTIEGYQTLTEKELTTIRRSTLKQYNISMADYEDVFSDADIFNYAELFDLDQIIKKFTFFEIVKLYNSPTSVDLHGLELQEITDVSFQTLYKNAILNLSGVNEDDVNKISFEALSLTDPYNKDKWRSFFSNVSVYTLFEQLLNNRSPQEGINWVDFIVEVLGFKKDELDELEQNDFLETFGFEVNEITDDIEESSYISQFILNDLTIQQMFDNNIPLKIVRNYANASTFNTYSVIQAGYKFGDVLTTRYPIFLSDDFIAYIFSENVLLKLLRYYNFNNDINKNYYGDLETFYYKAIKPQKKLSRFIEYPLFMIMLKNWNKAFRFNKVTLTEMFIQLNEETVTNLDLSLFFNVFSINEIYQNFTLYKDDISMNFNLETIATHYNHAELYNYFDKDSIYNFYEDKMFANVTTDADIKNAKIELYKLLRPYDEEIMKKQIDSNEGLSANDYYKLGEKMDALNSVGFSDEMLLDLSGQAYEYIEIDISLSILRERGYIASSFPKNVKITDIVDASYTKIELFSFVSIHNHIKEHYDQLKNIYSISDIYAYSNLSSIVKSYDLVDVIEFEKNNNIDFPAEALLERYSLRELVVNGYKIIKFKDAITTIIDDEVITDFNVFIATFNFTIKELEKEGFSRENLLKYNFSVYKWINEGYKFIDLYEKYGYKYLFLFQDEHIANDISFSAVKEYVYTYNIKSHGYSSKDMLNNGYDLNDVRKAGFKLVEISNRSDYTIEELYNVFELHELTSIYTLNEMKTATDSNGNNLFNIDDLYRSYDIDDIFESYSVTDLVKVYDVRTLLLKGIEITEIENNGITVPTELRSFVTPRDSGLDLRDLLKTYSLLKLKNDGYNPYELYKTLLTKTEIELIYNEFINIDEIDFPENLCIPIEIDVIIDRKNLVDLSNNITEITNIDNSGNYIDVNGDVIDASNIYYELNYDTLRVFNYPNSDISNAGIEINKSYIIDVSFISLKTNDENIGFHDVSGLLENGFDFNNFADVNYTLADLSGVPLLNMISSTFNKAHFKYYYTLEEFKRINIELLELKEIYYFTFKELYDGSFTLLELKEVGFKLSDFYYSNYNGSRINFLKDMKEIGFSPNDLLTNLTNKFTAQKLYDNNYSIKEILEGGYPYTELNTTLNMNDLSNSDIDAKILREYFNITPDEMKKAGLSDEYILSAKYKPSKIVARKEEGGLGYEFSDVNWKLYGYTVSDIMDSISSTSVIELRESNYSLEEILEVRFTIYNLKIAGYLPVEIIHVRNNNPAIDKDYYTNIRIIYAGGYELKDLANTFTASELRYLYDPDTNVQHPGYTPSQLSSYFSLNELVEAGFTKQDLAFDNLYEEIDIENAFNTKKVDLSLNFIKTEISNNKTIYSLKRDVSLNEFINSTEQFGINHYMLIKKNEIFDGNGFSINCTDNSFNGIFKVEYVDVSLNEDEFPIIKNIRIIGGNIEYRGGSIIKPWQRNYFIQNCSSSSNLNEECGGIVGSHNGYNGKVYVRNCYFEGAFNDSKYRSGGIVGGYFGINGIGEIENCVNKADIGEGSGGIGGGYIGMESIRTDVRNSINYGALKSEGSSGIVGFFAGASGTLYINSCYNVGEYKNSTIGGIAGAGCAANNGNCFISDCYSVTKENIDDQFSDIFGIVGNFSTFGGGNIDITNCYADISFSPSLPEQGFGTINLVNCQDIENITVDNLTVYLNKTNTDISSNYPMLRNIVENYINYETYDSSNVILRSEFYYNNNGKLCNNIENIDLILNTNYESKKNLVDISGDIIDLSGYLLFYNNPQLSRVGEYYIFNYSMTEFSGPYEKFINIDFETNEGVLFKPYDKEKIREMNLPILSMKELGFLPKELKEIYSSGEILSVGYSAQQLFDASYTIQQLFDSGYSLSQINRITPAIPKSQILTLGFNPRDLFNADYTAQELFDASYTVQQIFDSGYSLSQINSITPAIPNSQILILGIDANELREIGYTPRQLYDASYSLYEIKDGSYNLVDFSNSNFEPYELKNIFSLDNLIEHFKDSTLFKKFTVNEFYNANVVASYLFDNSLHTIREISMYYPINDKLNDLRKDDLLDNLIIEFNEDKNRLITTYSYTINEIYKKYKIQKRDIIEKLTLTTDDEVKNELFKMKVKKDILINILNDNAITQTESNELNGILIEEKIFTSNNVKNTNEKISNSIGTNLDSLTPELFTDILNTVNNDLVLDSIEDDTKQSKIKDAYNYSLKNISLKMNEVGVDYIEFDLTDNIFDVFTNEIKNGGAETIIGKIKNNGNNIKFKITNRTTNNEYRINKEFNGIERLEIDKNNDSSYYLKDDAKFLLSIQDDDSMIVKYQEKNNENTWIDIEYDFNQDNNKTLNYVVEKNGVFLYSVIDEVFGEYSGIIQNNTITVFANSNYTERPKIIFKNISEGETVWMGNTTILFEINEDVSGTILRENLDISNLNIIDFTNTNNTYSVIVKPIEQGSSRITIKENIVTSIATGEFNAESSLTFISSKPNITYEVDYIGYGFNFKINIIEDMSNIYIYPEFDEEDFELSNCEILNIIRNNNTVSLLCKGLNYGNTTINGSQKLNNKIKNDFNTINILLNNPIKNASIVEIEPTSICLDVSFQENVQINTDISINISSINYNPQININKQLQTTKLNNERFIVDIDLPVENINYNITLEISNNYYFIEKNHIKGMIESIDFEIRDNKLYTVVTPNKNNVIIEIIDSSNTNISSYREEIEIIMPTENLTINLFSSNNDCCGNEIQNKLYNNYNEPIYVALKNKNYTASNIYILSETIENLRNISTIYNLNDNLMDIDEGILIDSIITIYNTNNEVTLNDYIFNINDIIEKTESYAGLLTKLNNKLVVNTTEDLIDKLLDLNITTGSLDKLGLITDNNKTSVEELFINKLLNKAISNTNLSFQNITNIKEDGSEKTEDDIKDEITNLFTESINNLRDYATNVSNKQIINNNVTAINNDLSEAEINALTDDLINRAYKNILDELLFIIENSLNRLNINLIETELNFFTKNAILSTIDVNELSNESKKIINNIKSNNNVNYKFEVLESGSSISIDKNFNGIHRIEIPIDEEIDCFIDGLSKFTLQNSAETGKLRIKYYIFDVDMNLWVSKDYNFDNNSETENTSYIDINKDKLFFYNLINDDGSIYNGIIQNNTVTLFSYKTLPVPVFNLKNAVKVTITLNFNKI